MNVSEKIFELVEQALDELDQPNHRLSAVLGKAIRVARLRGDHEALWWLQMEATTMNTDAFRELENAVQQYFNPEEFQSLKERLGRRWVRDREIGVLDKHGQPSDEKLVVPMSVSEIESRIDEQRGIMAAIVTPSGLHPIDTYRTDLEYVRIRSQMAFSIREIEGVLCRIEGRIRNFLSVTEQQCLFGQSNADIFERNRRYVEQRLSAVSPEALSKLNAAYERLQAGDTEARSHAVQSCRRLLKSLADSLYPPRDEPVRGGDGKERMLTEDKYIARIWQFVAERAKEHRSGELLLASVNDLGHRIDRIYDLASKGVHEPIGEFEVNQCVIQTFMVVGDLLRLADNQVAPAREHDLAAT